MSLDCVFYSRSWLDLQADYRQHGAECFDGMSEPFFSGLKNCCERTRHMKYGIQHLSSVANYIMEQKDELDESDIFFVSFVEKFSVYVDNGERRKTDLPLEYGSVFSPESVVEIHSMLKRIQPEKMAENFESTKELEYIPWDKTEFLGFWNDILRVFADAGSNGLAVVCTRY